jgi:hypothetical protein
VRLGQREGVEPAGQRTVFQIPANMARGKIRENGGVKTKCWIIPRPTKYRKTEKVFSEVLKLSRFN